MSSLPLVRGELAEHGPGTFPVHGPSLLAQRDREDSTQSCPFDRHSPIKKKRATVSIREDGSVHSANNYGSVDNSPINSAKGSPATPKKAPGTPRSPWGTPSRSRSLREIRPVTVRSFLQEHKAAPVQKFEEVSKTLYTDRQYGPVRFVMLLLLFLVNIANASVAATFTTIATETAAYYGVSLTWVNSLYTANLICSFLFYFPASKLVDAYGIRVCFLVGAGANLVGVLIRVIGSEQSSGGFLLLLLGTTCCAVGCPFLNDLAPALSGQWFPPAERAQATAVGSLSQFLGFLAGVVMGTWMVDRIPELLVIQAIAGAVPTGVSLFIFKDNPDAEIECEDEGEDDEPLTVWRSMSALLSNTNYMLIVITVGLYFGVLYTLQGLVDQILPKMYKPHEYLLNVVPSIAGVMAGVAVGKYVDRAHNYSFALRLYCGLSLFFYTLFLRTVHITTPTGMWSSIALLCLSETFATGVLPVALELAVEVTFDANIHFEGISTALVLISTNLCATLVLYATSPDSMPAHTARWVWAGVMAVALFLLLFLKDDLRRLAHEKTELEEKLLSSWAPVL